jgi:hypothetical protein
MDNRRTPYKVHFRYCEMLAFSCANFVRNANAAVLRRFLGSLWAQNRCRRIAVAQADVAASQLANRFSVGKRQWVGL